MSIAWTEKITKILSMMADKTQIHIVQEPKRQELIQVCYGIIGCMQAVHNQLGPGLPEYIYQEALATEL